MKFLKSSILGIILVAIIVLIFLPPPPWMMDILLTFNILLGLLILLSALYAKEALDMSLFPTILLVSTLFRLVLNVCATRLILGEGTAGNVIDAFGQFVAGGNLVVGIIIFIIIVIVNFLVITKGSERVAEVTARFTLDAMPGKQMAIDADLNTGVIDDVEAKARRQKVQNESNFYGAMDGAVKFVKNDAIASILITFINIVGGIALGATGLATGTPLPIGEAAEIYTLMTIGDGLAGQIPSLLISAATGLIVTKATNESDITGTLVKQIFSQPVVIYISGGALVALGLFTAMPWYFLVPLGGLLLIAARRMGQKKEIESIQTEITADDAAVDEIRRQESVVNLLNVDPIVLNFGYGLIPLVESSQGGDLVDRIVMIRRSIAVDLGAVVPTIRLKDDIKLSPNEYKILIKGVEVASGDIMFDHYMAMNPGYVEEEIDGIETVEPYLGLPALWISESQRERAEAYGYTVVDPPAIIATHLTEIIRSHLHEILTRQDVQNLINNVKEQNSIVVEELIPKLMSVGDIQKVLSNLLREGISIKDMVTILETLADYAHMTRDTDMLTEYTRQALRRAISRKYFISNVNNVITLDPALEQQIMSNVQQTEQGSYLALEPQLTQKIFDKLSSEITKLTSIGMQPIILTSPIVRIYFKRLIETVSPELVVLSYNELDPTAEIQSVGMVSVA